MSPRTLLPAVIVAALIGLFLKGLYMNPGEIPSPFIGKAAPVFDLENLADPDARVRLENFAGRAFALNVWGTWCGGCRQEHATLMRIARSGTLPIVGINWRDSRDAALTWLQQTGDPYAATGFDPHGDAAIDWGVYGAPETFLIDARGTVIHKHIGPLDWATWQRDFIARIAGAPTP